MNKHFLKTLKRVLRDLESLEKRAPDNGADGQIHSQLCGAVSCLHIAVNVAEFDESKLSAAPPETPTEPQSEQTAQNQQEPQSCLSNS